MSKMPDMSASTLWDSLRREAELRQKAEPALAELLTEAVTGRATFTESLVHVLVGRLSGNGFAVQDMEALFTDIHRRNPQLAVAAQKDLIAVRERDPAASSLLAPFLFFKGYHALQTHRVAHQLWRDGRDFPALLLQSRVSERLAVDIHPAARIGQGVMVDHATGLVIGETAVVGDNVSLLHAVTLGGTGHERGDRHPKIGHGVLIGAGAKILGNIKIGDCARVAAGSVVLKDVPAHVTVAGVPARVVGEAGCEQPAEEMDQLLSSDCIAI